ncbi:T9SS type A sorting domain-containing protein [candidate division KSB1 bacterium]|nr:T9SS type A sorting domain-containing protein [candidate division KSB1 bacterium]
MFVFLLFLISFRSIFAGNIVETIGEGENQITVIYLKGRKVSTIVSSTLGAGFYNYSWNGTDQSGQPVRSGLYFVRLKSGNHNLVRRMVLTR